GRWRAPRELNTPAHSPDIARDRAISGERAGVPRAQRGTWAARPGAPGGPRPRREGRAPDRMCAMTVLVAYATHSGATRTLAETLADALRADGLDADLVDIEDGPDPRGVDAVVLGSAVRVESVEKSALTWTKTHLDTLRRRPFAFVSCSGSAADPAKGGKQKATDAYPYRFALPPVAVPNFRGWVPMGRIPVHERGLLTSMRTPTGDFRGLPAVTAWGHEIAPLLRG